MLDSVIYIRLTSEEKSIIQQEADDRNMELAPYARKKLLGKQIPRNCACGQHWGHTGKHWANTEVKS